MKKGFTFIEVSLVLAVAGLIFAMVFVALPALQRSSRDTTRRDDMSKFITAVKKYQTNNRGALPGGGEILDETHSSISVKEYKTGDFKDTSWQGFYNKYLGENFVDPLGESYGLNVVKCDAQTSGGDCKTTAQYYEQNIPVNYIILVVVQATCSNEKTVGSSNPRNLAALYRLESGGISCNNT